MTQDNTADGPTVVRVRPVDLLSAAHLRALAREILAEGAEQAARLSLHTPNDAATRAATDFVHGKAEGQASVLRQVADALTAAERRHGFPPDTLPLNAHDVLPWDWTDLMATIGACGFAISA